MRLKDELFVLLGRGGKEEEEEEVYSRTDNVLRMLFYVHDPCDCLVIHPSLVFCFRFTAAATRFNIENGLFSKVGSTE